MDQLEDVWLQQYRNGQVDGLQRLVEHYRQPLFAFIFRMTEGRDDADDIFQEVWFRVMKHHDKYTKNSFKSWLFRITRNLIIDRARKRRPMVDLEREDERVFETRLADPSLTPSSTVQGHDLGQRIRAAVAQLPDLQREVYLMRMEAHLSFKEIAVAQEVSINTALGRMHYAIGKLREALHDDYLEITS